jgi:acyl-CoA thioester hydrolase
MHRHISSPFRVRYGETDQMGVAYHPNYLAWCEIGRTEFIRSLGISYAEIERQGYFLAVAEATVRYATAARYDDLIQVETWLESARSRALTFGYWIAREDPDPARLATASTTLVAIDGDGRPRRLPGTILDLFLGAA